MRACALLLGVTSIFCPLEAYALSLCRDIDGRQVLTDTSGELLRCMTVGAERQPDSLDPAVPLSPPSSTTEASPQEPVRLDALPATAHAATVSVPLERLGSLLIVTVNLNHDHPAKLILDTGASHSLLSHKVAQDLGLFSFPPVALVTLQTVGGSVQAEVVQVDSIQLAGAEVRQSLAAIHDMPDAPPGIEGLLGQSFLRQFEVTVNAAKGELRLRSAK